MSGLGDMDTPGLSRPWREGDRFVLFFPNGAEVVGECSPVMADELNAMESVDDVFQALPVHVMPEAVLLDQGVQKLLSILRDNGPILYEHLEHLWEQAVRPPSEDAS